MKMYIAVLDTVGDFMTPTLVAHSVLSHHMETKNPLYEDWLKNSYKKVTVRVNVNEFHLISKLDHVYLGHENTTLAGAKSCAVIVVGDNVPNVLKFAKLWKPIV